MPSFGVPLFVKSSVVVAMRSEMVRNGYEIMVTKRKADCAFLDTPSRASAPAMPASEPS